MKAIKLKDFNSHKISEADIVKRILAGEKELYEILIRRNNQKLYRTIRSYIQDSAELEDIMQNTYLKAFEKLYQFKHTAQFSTWLIRIGINETLARLRTSRKIISLSNPSTLIDNDRLSELSDSNQLNPEKEIIRKEVKQILEAAIDKLSPKYRTVYILREIEGLSIREVADCLDISISNVKVRLHRAKAIIKEDLYALTLDKNVFEFGFSRCDRIVDFVMKSIL